MKNNNSISKKKERKKNTTVRNNTRKIELFYYYCNEIQQNHKEYSYCFNSLFHKRKNEIVGKNKYYFITTK